MIVSRPAPPLSVGWSVSRVMPVASSVSSPSRASIASLVPRSGSMRLTVAGIPLTVCVVALDVALIASSPWVPITVSVSTRRSAVLSRTSTFVVAVPPRSRTVTLSVPPNGFMLMCSIPPVSAEPAEAVDQAGAGEQALHLDEVVALGAGGAELVEAGAALDAVDAVGHRAR